MIASSVSACAALWLCFLHSACCLPGCCAPQWGNVFLKGAQQACYTAEAERVTLSCLCLIDTPVQAPVILKPSDLVMQFLHLMSF